MAAINFPDSPSDGDTHVVGGVTYTYNNAETKWKTTINSNAFLPLSGGTLSGNLTTTGDVVLGGELQHSGDTDTKITFGTDTINLDTAGSTRATVDSSGRLLVGTTSSSANNRAVIQGRSDNASTTGTVYIQRGAANPGSNSGLGQIFFADSAGSQGAYIYTQAESAWAANDYPTRLMFGTTADAASSPTERMRIASDGSIRNMTGLYLDYSGSSANVHIDSTGHLTRGSSSIRYKTQVEDLEDQYADALLECRPVWYRSRSKNDNPDWSFYGLIAEEVAEIDPRLVQWRTTNPVFQEDGSVEHEPCEPVAEGISYDRFVPHLLNLIKRQKEAIEALETRVAQLEGGTP